MSDPMSSEDSLLKRDKQLLASKSERQTSLQLCCKGLWYKGQFWQRAQLQHLYSRRVKSCVLLLSFPGSLLLLFGVLNMSERRNECDVGILFVLFLLFVCYTVVVISCRGGHTWCVSTH